jgi:hypothetical protein
VPSSLAAWNSIAALLVILGIAAWLIHRAGTELRDALREKSAPTGPVLTPAELEAITAHALATPEQLFAMRPSEQRLLATTAMALQAGQNQRPTRAQ